MSRKAAYLKYKAKNTINHVGVIGRKAALKWQKQRKSYYCGAYLGLSSAKSVIWLVMMMWRSGRCIGKMSAVGGLPGGC
jgi:hypothetical protein